MAQYRAVVAPILETYCLGCHSGTSAKAGVTFDSDDPAILAKLAGNRELWAKTLKTVRAGLMPPAGNERPSAEQIGQLEGWIKGAVLRTDPKNPDPGRVTIRRLNRVEYRNTVRDLLGVDFDAGTAFPADDTGHGFDTIGDVLSLSPLRVEKYVAAARTVVARAVPTAPRVVAESRITGKKFGSSGGEGPLALSYYTPAQGSYRFEASHPGRYEVVVDLVASETYVDNVFDYNRCRFAFKADGKVLSDVEYSRQGGQKYRYSFDLDWTAGGHELAFDLRPLTPDEKRVRDLALRVEAVTVRGPLAEQHWVPAPNYTRFFPNPIPVDPHGRRGMARTLLRDFATRAFRRSPDADTLDRLVEFAVNGYADGRTFEAGIAKAMTAVLASPRFLFREEGTLPGAADEHPFVDEYALASRLSYFLWSSMPDAELFALAGENKLREDLAAQIDRMLRDPRSGAFVQNFVGQWLQTRSLETVQVNAAAIARQEVPPGAEPRRGANRGASRPELTPQLRKDMQRETELSFEYVMRNDRRLTELLDCDYTFLNERLARHYGINGVTGEQMRRVELPKDSPRGGVLTQASFLVVTSNPDRTSPVKRGLFVLDNILGTPPPPPPPDIPGLEESATAGGKKLTVREAMAAHRSQATCRSCHNRMDPLGLAFENFNALGRWRAAERGEPIDAAGTLVSGEKFSDIRGLKRAIVSRRLEFYRCLTEKLMVYALGRGLETSDIWSVDEIAERVENSGVRLPVLLTGIIESPQFQKRRAAPRPSSLLDADHAPVGTTP